MKFLPALVAGALLSFAPAHAHDPRVEAAEAALQYACSVLEDDCSDLSAPRIQFLELGWNLLGTVREMPDGSVELVLNISMLDDVLGNVSPSRGYEILAHEATHYVDIMRGRLTPPSKNGGLWDLAEVCASEKRAWRTSNLYWLENGRPDRAIWNWIRAYPHCQ